MNFSHGKKYKVKDNHPHHSNKIGLFQFMGGTERDVVVLLNPEHSDKTSLAYFGVFPEDIEKEVK